MGVVQPSRYGPCCLTGIWGSRGSIDMSLSFLLIGLIFVKMDASLHPKRTSSFSPIFIYYPSFTPINNYILVTYTTVIHCIQCYRHLFVHLIQVYSYINSLRQVSHHPIICTNVHLLVDPNVADEGPLSRQIFPTTTLSDHNIVLCSRGCLV